MNSIDIYSTLVSKCPNTAKNLHYLKRYMKLIIHCSNQKQTNGFELHHILPKADNLWPEYANLTTFTWNSIHLTERQHRLAHWMLARTFGGTMWYAFNLMKSRSPKPVLQSTSEEISKNLDPSTWVKSHWQDADARKQHVENMVKSWTEERRASHSAIISSAWTTERKAKQSNDRTGDLNHFKGKHHTDETKSKIKQAFADKPFIECPHCLMTSKSPSNMKRYHFDMCKAR